MVKSSNEKLMFIPETRLVIDINVIYKHILTSCDKSNKKHLNLLNRVPAILFSVLFVS